MASLQFVIVYTLRVVQRLTLVRTGSIYHKIYAKTKAQFNYNIIDINVKLLKILMR